jgi:pyrroloquinoline-quinone synthase
VSDPVLETRLRGILDARYHDRHPFNLRMHDGTLTSDEIRRWVRNRYYYQTRIPIKDGLILTKTEDPSFRRGWIRRIHDHEGTTTQEGGLELWLRLAEAVGLQRSEVASLGNVLPGVRRACDAYVEFVSSHDLLESVASSLTELAAGALLGARAEAFEKHPEKLSAADWGRVFGEAAELGVVHVGLTGGEPTTRRDLVEIIGFASRADLYTHLVTAGIPLEPAGLGELRDAGLRSEDESCLVVLPERAVRLGGSGQEILAACDGERSVEEVAAEMRRLRPEVDGIEADVYEFLEQMEGNRVLEMLP